MVAARRAGRPGRPAAASSAAPWWRRRPPRRTGRGRCRTGWSPRRPAGRRALSRPHRLGGAGEQAHPLRVAEIVTVLDQGAVAIEENGGRPRGSRPQGRGQRGGHRGLAAGSSVRGSSRTRPVGHPGDERRDRRAGGGGPVRRRRAGRDPGSPGWWGARRRGTRRRRPRTRPASVAGRSSGGQAAARPGARAVERGRIQREHPEHGDLAAPPARGRRYSASVASSAASVSLSARSARASGFARHGDQPRRPAPPGSPPEARRAACRR